MILADTNVDEFARVVAIAAATAAFGRLFWEIGKYILTGRKVMRNHVTSTDEPRQLLITSTNDGRRQVFVRNARLRYLLGQQELFVTMPNSRGTDDDTVLQPHGDSIQFRCPITSDNVMQLKLAFQEDPNSFYITIESMGGIVATLTNSSIQPTIRHLLNEFDPIKP